MDFSRKSAMKHSNEPGVATKKSGFKKQRSPTFGSCEALQGGVEPSACVGFVEDRSGIGRVASHRVRHSTRSSRLFCRNRLSIYPAPEPHGDVAAQWEGVGGRRQYQQPSIERAVV